MYIHRLIWASQPGCAIIFLALEKKKLRHREGERLAQGDTAGLLYFLQDHERTCLSVPILSLPPTLAVCLLFALLTQTLWEDILSTAAVSSLLAPAAWLLSPPHIYISPSRQRDCFGDLWSGTLLLHDCSAAPTG